MKFTSALALAATVALVEAQQNDMSQKIYNFGVALGQFNIGMMQAMQVNQNNTANQCA